eukprot:6212826-Pleurochrysis_carterae.AAC.1
MLSVRPLPLSSPKRTPRSYSRLNSKYRPRLSSCHSRCSGVCVMLRRLATIGSYDGIKLRARARVKSAAPSSARSSKKMPPMPRVSPRHGR